MADVNINKFRASVVRDGSKPASPGFIVSEGQDPVDPAGNGQNHLPVTIATAATGLSITDSQVLGGAGTIGQYIRGDGSLADFPQASGGGSSVSYYLNGSISQGTIGGVAYKELNKVPILGAGTDFTINADGYIASFLTDAGDPNLLEIPGGNWNFETYFSASSSGGTPSFYVELYKYDGTTFTLIASSSSSPELIAFGTNLNPYFSTLAVPTTTLALTDRLAIRYYVTHSGRTITLHTENNHLCQVVTTFTTGLTSLNGLTAQVQNLAVGTSGTDFNIASATATHTFNLPTASATNRGALNSADWTTFNNKQNALGYVPVPETRTITINGVSQDLSANRTYNVGTVTSVGLSSATSGVTIGSTPVTTSGTITLAIATASGSQNGLLSSTDWTTFNNKIAGTLATGQVAFGTAANTVGGSSTFTFSPTAQLLLNNSVTASSAIGRGANITSTLVAAANNDVLVGLDISPTFTNGAFTGVSNIALRTIAPYTSLQRPQVRFSSGVTASAFELVRLAGSTEAQKYQFITGFNGTQLELFAQSTSGGTYDVNVMSFFRNGNVVINSTTDAGFRLDVNGTARVQGVLTTTADAVVNSVSIGRGAGNISTNTSVGTNALSSNTTGGSNAAYGFDSLRNNTIGGGNAAYGRESLFSNTTGNGNVAIGINAGRHIANGTTANTITNNSIFLGALTRANADNETNQIVIGHTAIGGGSNTVVIGNSSIVSNRFFGTMRIGTINNGVGDFITTDANGVLTKRTAAQTLTDIGAQAALTNPVTGTGTTNYLPKFTGSTTIGNSLFTDNGTNGGIGGANYASGTDVRSFNISAPLYAGLGFWANNVYVADIFGYSVTGNLLINADPTNVFTGTKIGMSIDGTERLAIFNDGNVSIGNSPTNNGAKLQVSGNGFFSGSYTTIQPSTNTNSAYNEFLNFGGYGYIGLNSSTGGNLAAGTPAYAMVISTYKAGGLTTPIQFAPNNSVAMTITSSGNVLIGTSTDAGNKLSVAGGIAMGNNTDGTTNLSYGGRISAKLTNVTGGAGATLIHRGLGSVGYFILVSGIQSSNRFMDLIYGTGGNTPIVLASNTENTAPTRTYSISGENIRVALSGSAAWIITTTGLGAMEA